MKSMITIECTETHRNTQKHTETHRNTQKHTETHRNTQKHTETVPEESFLCFYVFMFFLNKR